MKKQNRIRGFELVARWKDSDIDFIPPARGSKKSACYDMFNNTGEDIVLEPNEISGAIATGYKSYMLDDEVLKAYVRSGHGFSYSVRLANSTGIIDCDYYEEKPVLNKKGKWVEGEIFIKLHNQGTETLTIPKGEGMAQVMFQKYLLADGDSFEIGDDRTDGFGSTSK